MSIDNEHLGQIISAKDQEQKNIDLRISKARNCLFGMLGPAFQYKCLLSPVLKFHLFRTYISPILRSGLSSFALKASQIHSITIFHRKILRGILNFSKSSNLAPLYFLLGELPIEAQIHRDVFSLFYNVWINPNSKISQIIKYLLQNSPEKSKTWSIFVRNLAVKYDLTDPLECLNSNAPSKANYKEHITTKISAYHEKSLRAGATNNSRMKYFNISLISLRGQHHPALKNIITSHEVRKCRIHLKMLSGDYLTYSIKASHSGGSPHGRLCKTEANVLLSESTEHMLTSCVVYDEIRERIFPQYDMILKESKLKCTLNDFQESNETLCQVILDPTSLNLKYRLQNDDPSLNDFFKLSRDLCYAIHNLRKTLLDQTK